MTTAHILERASNELLYIIHGGLEEQLDLIDDIMREEDEKLGEIMGSSYGFHPTPKPALYRMGHLPTLEKLTIDDYPYISCWGQDFGPIENNGGYSENTGRMFVQGLVLARDPTWIARVAYRYIGAVQNLLSETTLHGLCDPVVVSGRVDITPTLKREFDDARDEWFVQIFMYSFFASFMEEHDIFSG